MLQPLLDHMNALLKTGACARVCRSWCGAVVAWRRAMRRIVHNSTEKRGYSLTDAGLRALVRECPLVGAFSLWIDGDLISSTGLKALGGLGHLRHLHLMSFGACLRDASAFKAIGDGCPHLEYVHLPLTTGAALQELLRPAQRLQQLFVPLWGAGADTISALARCTTLRALGVSFESGATFDTVALRALAEGLTALELLRIDLDCSAFEVTPEKDLVALVETLALHEPCLQHLALRTDGYRSSVRVEHHQPPPPTDETWHQHIPWDQKRDPDRHSYNEECAMALRFPTQQAVADEMCAIDAALTALGKGCPLLEHLELPGGLSVYSPRRSYHPEPEPLFISDAADELSFPKLRHFGVGNVGAGEGVVALGTIQALGEAAPELRTLALGNCLRMVHTPDPTDALAWALNECPRLLMLDVTGWKLPMAEAMDMFDNPWETVDNPCTQPCLYSTKYGDMSELAEPVGDWFQNGRNTPEQLRRWTPNGLLAGNRWKPATSCLCVGCRSYAELMQ